MVRSLFLFSLLTISALSVPVPEEAPAESTAAPASGEKKTSKNITVTKVDNLTENSAGYETHEQKMMEAFCSFLALKCGG